MTESKQKTICKEKAKNPKTIITEDGREMEVPDQIQFRIEIGRKNRMDKGYITDEMMTLSSPSGWLIGNEIPQPLRGVIQNPQIESEQGDIRVWECPAGSHAKPNRFKSMLEFRDGIEIESYEEDVGRKNNKTRIRVQITTKNIDLQST
jgi:hypothetical protein